MFLRGFLILILFLPFLVSAKPIVADLALRSIEIDTNFTGIDILLFGARDDAGDIVIVVRGQKKIM